MALYGRYVDTGIDVDTRYIYRYSSDLTFDLSSSSGGHARRRYIFVRRGGRRLRRR